MTPENINPAPRELKFGGEGKSNDIERGFAIATIRNPRPAYNFAVGEIILADCFDDGKKVPVVVIANETRELKEFSVPQLAMDGFFSAEHVVDGMKSYPGYENLNEDSSIQAITFAKEEAFGDLPEELKIQILDDNVGFDELINTPELRHLFFPTMLQHMLNRGTSVYEWGDFLYFNNLIEWTELNDSRMNHYRGENIYDMFLENQQVFEKVMLHPGSAIFSAMVCFQPDKNLFN